MMTSMQQVEAVTDWHAVTDQLPMQALAAFRRHSLADVGEQSLMSRYDTKFLLPLEFLPAFLQQLQDEYSLLEIDERILHSYRTVYFDDDGFSHYRAHHNRRMPRCKIRSRSYVDSGRSYLEIKCKNNRGRTDKQRVSVGAGLAAADLQRLLLQPPFAASSSDVVNMCGRVAVEYQRLALWSRLHGERVSIDMDLQFTRCDASGGLRMTALAIVELKQSVINRASPARTALRRFGVRPRSFSKYCVGCALLYPLELRCNRFKPLLLQLSPHIESTNWSDRSCLSLKC